MSGPAPLRFLVLVVGGWVGFRLVMLAPDWIGGEAEGAPARAEAVSAAAEPAALIPAPSPSQAPGWASAPILRPDFFSLGRGGGALAVQAEQQVMPALLPFPTAAAVTPPVRALGPETLQAYAPAIPQPTPLPLPLPRRASRESRWSASAWLFLRGGGGSGGLAPGGTLGGSQAGARLAYRLNGDPGRPLAISARLYAPLERPRGAEAALGIDWRPVRNVPVHLLAERRQRIGREARSDFALSIYGGGERRFAGGRGRIEAYGQAGVVGVEEQDPFADGFVRAGLASGPIEVGAGLWGGAQPGAARLDAGPQASARLSVGAVQFRASAEWRFRIAGDAAPGSGPAFTIAAGF